MRVPLEWMGDYCAPDLDARVVGERLDLTGTEVSRVERHGVGRPDRFVVGRVLDARPHPDADRLRLCRVDIGEAEEVQIVCGADNVATGQTVAVARPGAVMPDGTELGVVRLRGVESHGMILAEDELAIGVDHGGILVLEEGPDPGTALSELIPLGGEVLELAITPNRPDCLSVYGIAREVHAATTAPLAAPPWATDPGSAGAVEGVEVEVADPDLCPRFTARVFEGVRVGPSPPWLKARLMAAGQRPINNVVDITNYVMLLTGQPLHAFDLDRVAGGRLIVRRARDGERMTTLDGAQRTLDSDVVVICDAEGPTSIAAVMGGERSEVEPGTTRILLEVATWNGPNIQRTSTRLGLRSEASARFEKQLQPEQTIEAQAVAAQLMLEVCGASLAPGTVDVGGPGPQTPAILLRHREIEDVLGIAIDPEEAGRTLRSLEFGTDPQDGEGLLVKVPARRRDDVSREIDLIEEVARMCALGSLPATLPARTGAGGLTAEQRLRRRAEDALVGRGLREIAGWSFAPADLPDRLRLAGNDHRRAAVALANPMSESESVLRTTLLGSLLDVARRNLDRGAEAVRLFESGAVYLYRAEGELPSEPHALGLVLIGPVRPGSWADPDPGPADLHAARAMLEAVCAALRIQVEVEPGDEPFLAPGRAGEVRHEGRPVGWVGELHPRVGEAWDLPETAALEIDLGALCRAAAVRGPERFRGYSEFPPVREDIAVVVPETVPARTVVEAVERAGGKDLASTRLFDVYRGEQVGEGHRSLALRLEFRAPDRTLTDEQVAEHRSRITAALGEIGGTLRD